MQHRTHAGIRCALGLALLGAAFASFEAAATCYTNGTVPPGTPTYDVMYPEPSAPAKCPPTTPRSVTVGTQAFLVVDYRMTMEEPASPASVVCSEGGWTNDCIAWPQGSNITYTWSATGGVTLDYVPSPHDYEVILNCTGNASGTGRVTVYAPGWGAAQNAASVAHCGNQ